MILQPIIQWFGPPRLARSDLRQSARALWMVSWPFFVVVAALLGLAVIVEPYTFARRATTIAAVGSLIALLHSMSRAGRPMLASWMLVIGLTTIVTQRAWITGGIHAPAAVFYALFIIVAGVLLGTRGARLVAAACLVGAMVLTIGTTRGWLTPRPGAGSAEAALVFTSLAIGLSLVIHELVSFGLRYKGLEVDAVQSVVSDMRSPMQTLLTRLELLQKEVRGESAQDVEEALDGVDKLRRLTSILLDVSRLESGRMPVTPTETDLLSLAQAVVADLRSARPTSQATVRAIGEITCACDPDLTRRIVEHLVRNAMSVTPADRSVRVVVAGSRKGASVAVIDDGPAVSPDTRSRMLAQRHADRRHRNCTGEGDLGLAFCQMAAEAQGGAIRFEDARPGNAVVLELPDFGRLRF